MDSENRINSSYIALDFNNQGKRILSEYPSTTASLGVESYGLTSGNLKGKESKSYELSLWMDEHVTASDDAMNKSFTSKVVVNASLNQVVEIYKEDILNGADPVLADNLIPVEIGNDGRVTKANTQNEWYSYQNKRWANAVILEDESITYQDYEEIPEDNIESYFVWIPKYSYQLWDLGEYEGISDTIDESKVHTIPIKFGLENTSDSVEGECTTPMNEEKTQGLSGESGNCKIGDYMTPPAFISMNTNGLWVGKFETGYKGATSASEAHINENNSSKVQIKSNIYSWGSIQPANAHLTSYNYKRELDSHMMKNTEWGAVAYLQHSKYGSATSVRINNNKAYLTGYAAISEPTTGYGAYNQYESTSVGVDGTNTINYKNPLSQVASTTGNYTGIYDMSGGESENVMSVMFNESNAEPISGRNSTYNSGFNGVYSEESNFLTSGVNLPDNKYYDKYTYKPVTYEYNKRILGDATAEVGPFVRATYGNSTRVISSWYSDELWVGSQFSSWLSRGSVNNVGSGAGVFAELDSDGRGYAYNGFRIVLAI